MAHVIVDEAGSKRRITSSCSTTVLRTTNSSPSIVVVRSPEVQPRPADSTRVLRRKRNINFKQLTTSANALTTSTVADAVDNNNNNHNMALQTPRQRGLQRPSYGTASSPSLRASANAFSNDVNRKASLRALNGNTDPRTPASDTMDDLEVGDAVNVPGDMYGTVKFIGSVRGKNGKFVGVELDREFAAKGKNDGDVDGTHYFQTSIPGAGIFLPVHRAEKRASPSVSIDSFPATPNTPSYSTNYGQRTHGPEGVPLNKSAAKFSKTVGPSARPTSPAFKPRRPSLPRPESPLRKQPPSLAPTPARGLSASQRGTPRLAGRTATTAAKTDFSRSTSRPSTTAAAPTPRPYSRTGSRLGNRPGAATENSRNGSSGSSQPVRSGSRLGSGGAADNDEILQLRAELAERDRRLAEQAASLSDMEASVKELSGLLPTEGDGRGFDSGATGDETNAQLRQMLREKNEKITLLTSEFDAHRADFRSTLDSLEMASTETERVYEEQKRDLIAQVEELSDRNRELEEVNASKKEFDDVARQLKVLEEFVQELEEGLEDARRGEAEARGEVEFLRGEVERGRSELRREREKAAAAVNGVSSPKEVEQKDDEIRGLKAIIHSFSTGPDANKSNGDAHIDGSDDLHRLQAALDESQKAKEDLEQELEQLRRDTATTNGHHARNESEMTATAQNSFSRPRGDTIRATFAEHAARRIASTAQAKQAANVYCEMCESSEHDTLDCNQFQQGNDTSTEGASEAETKDDDDAVPVAPSPGKENQDVGGAVEKAEVVDEDKWCALCEKDGHLAYECPDEQY